VEAASSLEHAVVGEGAFGPGPGVCVGKREIAHSDDECTLDVRLTKSVISFRRSGLGAGDRKLHNH
jgi:hypothetical protein